VKPGGTKQINARIGGVFVVESRDGTIHEIHSPAFPEKTINIQQP
jgi:iduronate 2-sulfatase